MKVIFDDEQKMFLVSVEHPETETWINTDDITKAREEFIKRMTWLFNDAVCGQLKASLWR